MRENRKSGSEGGAGLIPRPDPYPGGLPGSLDRRDPLATVRDVDVG